MGQRKNSRQKEFILAPFQKKFRAKSKKFWRGFLSLFGAGFCAISGCNFVQHASSSTKHHSRLKKVTDASIAQILNFVVKT
ncbi:hypothetical protein, partial [Porphyromonas loveana]|uniref:hypothetical protein n=1 Tax=Porphyromonas loveana TaxID=1884669 RepID=UPI00359F2B91